MTSTNLDKGAATKAAYQRYDSEASIRVDRALKNGKIIAFSADTNCYYSSIGERDIDFQQNWQNKLIAMSGQGLKFIIPSIWERETLKHACTAIPKQLVNYSRPKFNDPVLISFIESAQQRVQELRRNKESISEEMWQKHKAASKAIVIDIDSNRLNEILDWYFTPNPPFNSKEDKKYEFPDAFALTSIEKYAKDNDIIVAVASADMGCLDFCVKSKFLIGFSSAEIALERLSTKNEIDRLLIISELLSKKYALDSSPITDGIQAALFEALCRPLNEHQPIFWDGRIFGSFQPKVRLDQIVSIKLRQSDQLPQLIHVESDSESIVYCHGVAEVTAMLSHFVNAYDPDTSRRGTIALSENEPYTFSIRYNAQQNKNIMDTDRWWVQLENLGPSIPLFQPPANWEPASMA